MRGVKLVISDAHEGLSFCSGSVMRRGYFKGENKKKELRFT
jgi:hypothetical protein